MNQQEDDNSGRELTALLEGAANGHPGAVEAFFELLLRSSVYVPLKAPRPEVEVVSSVDMVGEGKGKHDFSTVEYDGKECVPIFTEQEFVEVWSEREVPVIRQQFKTLLWMIGDDTWLYLNPAQEVGKEITAWEVELLRQGPDAIPELAAALNESPIGEIEVRSTGEVYTEFKEKLRPILEVYTELEEAFLVAVKEAGSDEEKPMVGLRWSKANQGKRQYIKSEIEELGRDYLPGGSETVFVIDDLDNPDSPNHSLFSDATPFYFSKPYQKPGSGGLKQKLLGLFGKK